MFRRKSILPKDKRTPNTGCHISVNKNFSWHILSHRLQKWDFFIPLDKTTAKML
jgi:hypothetical protein